MRNFILLVTLIFVTTALFAQNDMHESIHKALKGYKLDNKTEFAEKHNTIPGEANLLEPKLFAVNNTREMIWVNDSTLSYSADGTEWNLTRRYKVLNRDEYGNMINAIGHFYEGTTETWTKKDTITATYYNAEIRYKYIEKPWNSNTQQWADTSRYYELDENGTWLVNFLRPWNYNDNGFTSYGYLFYRTFNDNGDLLYEIDYKWNKNTQEWYLSDKYSYNYDDNGNQTQTLVEKWNSDTEEWENSYQYIYSYDDNENITQRLIQSWNSETEDWENSYQDIYSYDDNGNRIQYLKKSWNSETEEWEISYQYLYSYDDNGNQTQYLKQNWNNETEDWENYWQFITTYDDNGNWTQYIFQMWNSETEDWENSYQYLYSYDDNGNQTQ